MRAIGGHGGLANVKDLESALIGDGGNGGNILFLGGNGGEGFFDCITVLVPGGKGGNGGNATGDSGTGEDDRIPGVDGAVTFHDVGNGGSGGDGVPAEVGGLGGDETVGGVPVSRIGKTFENGIDGMHCLEKARTWVGGSWDITYMLTSSTCETSIPPFTVPATITVEIVDDMLIASILFPDAPVPIVGTLLLRTGGYTGTTGPVNLGSVIAEEIWSGAFDVMNQTLMMDSHVPVRLPETGDQVCERFWKVQGSRTSP